MRILKFDFACTKTKNILLLLVYLISLTSCFSQRGRNFNIQPPQTSTRTITNVNLPFREQWRRSNLLLLNTKADRLYLYGNQLFFVSHDDDEITRRLEALDTKNGTLLWATELFRYSPDSLAVDDQRLYLALSSKLIAYDRSTGEALWEDALPGGRTSYQVYPMGETLLVYSEEDISQNSYEEQVIRKYDAQSGVLIGIDHAAIPQKNSSLLLRTSGFDYWADARSLWAVHQTHQEQWRIEIDDRVQYNPLLIGSKLIFASGIFSDVICIDSASGRQIWKYREKIVSDLAARQGTIYAIRTDATIVGIDSTTGKEIGYINVEPHVTETSSRSNAYLIAVSDNMMFVYYGDSRDLIAFSK